MTTDPEVHSLASRVHGPTHYSEVPQDARLITLIIASMGIQDIEPGVEMMLLEWAHRYVQTILSDSLLYSAHAHPSSSSNPSIALPDLILAIQSHLSHSIIQQPSKSTLLSLASSLNSIPLPPISDRFGLRLPPRDQCLTNVNFRIVPEPLDDPDDDDYASRVMTASRPETTGLDDAAERSGQPPASSSASQVGEEDATDGADLADAIMEESVDATATLDVQQSNGGIKRSFDEDDDYD